MVGLLSMFLWLVVVLLCHVCEIFIGFLFLAIHKGTGINAAYKNTPISTYVPKVQVLFYLINLTNISTFALC